MLHLCSVRAHATCSCVNVNWILCLIVCGTHQFDSQISVVIFRGQNMLSFFFWSHFNYCFLFSLDERKYSSIGRWFVCSIVINTISNFHEFMYSCCLHQWMNGIMSTVRWTDKQYIYVNGKHSINEFQCSGKYDSFTMGFWASWTRATDENDQLFASQMHCSMNLRKLIEYVNGTLASIKLASIWNPELSSAQAKTR